MPFDTIHHKHLETVDSTNDYATQFSDAFDLSCLNVISATTQTRGRGTKGSFWHSKTAHNIYATYLFETNTIKDLQCLAQLLSLSIANVLSTLHFTPTIKWPNDVLIDHKKIAGVLCEIKPKAQQSLIILGMGLNVNMPKSSLHEIDQPANSLLAASGKIFSSQEVLKKITLAFQKDLNRFLDEGFAPFCDLYNTYMVYRDLPVIDNKKMVGFSQKVTQEGLLECRGKHGEVKALLSGSIQIRS